MRLQVSSRRQADLGGRAELGDSHLLEEPEASREVPEELGGMYRQVLQEEMGLNSISSRRQLRTRSVTRLGSIRPRSMLRFRVMLAKSQIHESRAGATVPLTLRTESR